MYFAETFLKITKQNTTVSNILISSGLGKCSEGRKTLVGGHIKRMDTEGLCKKLILRCTSLIYINKSKQKIKSR